MKVLTITSAEFPAVCSSLATEVSQSGYNPDIIIGISNGGSHVGLELHRHFQNATYTDVNIHRKGSKTKNKSAIRFIISRLPKFINNWLRIIESFLHQQKKRHIRLGEISFSKDISEMLSTKGKKILIVDDAIDSGATMAKLIDYINTAHPDNTIKVAAITVTTKTPIKTADYYLYHNNTLIRFPWAIDA